MSERDEEMKEIPLIPENIRVDGVSRWTNKASQIFPKTKSTLKLPFTFPFLCISYTLKREFSTVGRWRRLEGKGEMGWRFLHVSFMSRYCSLSYSLRVWIFRRLTDSLRLSHGSTLGSSWKLARELDYLIAISVIPCLVLRSLPALSLLGRYRCSSFLAFLLSHRRFSRNSGRCSGILDASCNTLVQCDLSCHAMPCRQIMRMSDGGISGSACWLGGSC